MKLRRHISIVFEIKIFDLLFSSPKSLSRFDETKNIQILEILSTYLPTYLPTYLSTYLPIYLPTHLPIYLGVRNRKQCEWGLCEEGGGNCVLKP